MNSAVSPSEDEARDWLKEQWREADGRLRCPECGCPAVGWYRQPKTLYMECEDCGNRIRRYFET